MNTGVVIVNYNCAGLALDAALSVLADEPEARVVIVDNASSDGSLAYFEEVLAGRRKHIPQAPAGGPVAVRFARLAALSTAIISEGETTDARLVILKAKTNHGFAAGCNLGLRFLHHPGDTGLRVLLNPDALLARGAMAAFAARLGDSGAGLAGGSVLRFEAPYVAQAFGGARLNPWTLQGGNIGAGRTFANAPEQSVVEAAMDYPLGAAMAFHADYLEQAGPLDERFFLYFEEADWARRGRSSRPVWARDAVIYHRHGAAAGSRQAAGKRGALSDFHMARSRMLYAMKWCPLAVPLIAALSLGQSARRFLRGHRAQARAVLAGTFSRAGTISH